MHQAFDGPASLLFSCPCWCVGRDAIVMAPPTMGDSGVLPCFHGYPAFSTGISHHNLLPHLPRSVSAVNSSPHLHSPQTLPSRPCTFQVTLVPGMYDCGKDRLIPIPFRPPQISCFTLGLKCFSSDSDKCPDVGIGPRLQFPHPLRAGPVLLTLLFFPLIPSSY